MSKVIKIKKGLDINLKGAAEKIAVQAEGASAFAIKPPDFIGLTPKIIAKPGDEVKVGSPVFYDKHRPSVLFVSPVSGVVKEVVRGERRKILEVVIEPKDHQEFEEFKTSDPAGMQPDAVREVLLKSGLWPALIQRPYGILADPDANPKGIFISGFDSGPLGVDYDVILKDQDKNFAAGIAALQKLTTGKVYLSLRDGEPVAKAFSNLKDVEYNTFQGPHPSGLVGIQIHHISPINKGEIAWTINPQHVALIGKLFLTGHLDTTIVVAVSGSALAKPRYMKTVLGTSVVPLLQDQQLNNKDVRVISGNVLTGKRVSADGFLGFFDSLLSVIPEGNYYELFGWVTPGLNKFSNSRAFFSWLQPGKKWDIDTNLKGGERAFVMTGQYEKVFPMDIYPVFLLKSILVNDIDKMEQLGIYEVIEEDMALCEFVCTSKIEVQTILRTGLDLMYKEMN